jgi:orotate phosphoribosyltransferase
MNVLLIDDTMTTGAHVQSAASALMLAGATVVAAVPIGRYLNPVRGKEPVRELLAKAKAEVYDFEECCLEHASRLQPPT